MPWESKYNADYHDDWAWSLAVDGKTEKEIAEAFHISDRTLRAWKKDHASFRKKIEDGKMPADARVKASLFKRATGYDYDETERNVEWGLDGKQKPIRVKTVKKHIAPDTMAAMYWLNNRSRLSGEWTQKQEVNVNVHEDDDRVIIYLPEIDQ